MKRTLKMTAIAVAIAGATLGMAGPAQAGIFYTGTIAGWLASGGVLDGDTDTMWRLTNYGTAAPNTDIGAAGVTLGESEIGGQDQYTITVDFRDATGNGGIGPNQQSFLNYLVSITNDEVFLSASLDSTVPGQTPDVTVVKEIFGPAVTLLTTLTSIAGGPDGPQSISGQSITVNETFDAGENGFLTGTTNTYAIGQVPEPGTIALLGLGLAGLGLMRRRKV